MATEQYSIGYEEGYQAGWNAAMESLPAPVQQEPQEKAIEIAQAFSRGHDAGWESATAHHKALAAPVQQEPVGMVINEKVYSGFGEQRPVKTVQWRSDPPPAGTSVYTSPPAQRTWVGLTENDKQIAFDDTQEGGGFWEFADAIEAKLREKNA